MPGRKSTKPSAIGSFGGAAAASSDKVPKRTRRKMDIDSEDGDEAQEGGMEAKENFQEQAEATKNEARTKPARKPTNSTSKLAGSLFAPVLLDEPRRRNTFSMPDKPQTRKEDMTPKTSKAKTASPLPVAESPAVAKPQRGKGSSAASPMQAFPAVPARKAEAPKIAGPTPNEAELAKRLGELQTQFEQLSVLRLTSAEQLLEDYKRSAEDRNTAAQKLVESLKSENRSLKERLAAATTKSSRESNVSTLSTSTTDQFTANALVDLYRGLSGLAIQPVGQVEGRWECTVEGRLGSYEFELEYDEEEEEYTYKPRFTAASAVWDRLPAYLKEEIVFGQNHLQSFFWRALNFLMSQ